MGPYSNYVGHHVVEFQFNCFQNQIVLLLQKSRRWCVIDFENKAKLEEARSELKKIKIQNKGIKLRPYRKGPIKKAKPEIKPAKQSEAGASTKSLVKLLKN